MLRRAAAGPGRAHTDFAEAKLQRRLIEGQLEDDEIDALSVVALAGASAEAMQYEEVRRRIFPFPAVPSVAERTIRKVGGP